MQCCPWHCIPPTLAPFPHLKIYVQSLITLDILGINESATVCKKYETGFTHTNNVEIDSNRGGDKSQGVLQSGLQPISIADKQCYVCQQLR